MLRAEPGSGFQVLPLFTVGERLGDYQPPGVLDGLVAFPKDAQTARIFATHELEAGEGYAYTLANGTTLTGARISWFDLDLPTRTIRNAGPAYREIRDRQGREVTDPVQLNQGRGGPVAGLESFCSAAGYRAGRYGFVDDILFAQEEVTRREGHPHGGSVFALDVRNGVLWAAPELGRGSWENVTALATPDADQPDGHVALLLGDDYEFGRAPLYLWIGRKEPAGGFLARNGLARGRLHVWVAANGDRTPGQWSGNGTVRDGRFVPLADREPAAAGKPGRDALGYLDDDVLRSAAGEAGAFLFSRPEDLHTNPANGRQAVFSSTGHGQAYPEDDWGGLYVADLRFATGADGFPEATARLTLIYDSDVTGDLGIRSPDNLVWAQDGRIYVQEDKATKVGRFGEASGREASIWSLDPDRPAAARRIAEIDRSAVPAGARDRKQGETGAWESSGIIDLSAVLEGNPGEFLLLADVQAHGITDGPIDGAAALVEGGQLLLLSRGTGEAAAGALQLR